MNDLLKSLNDFINNIIKPNQWLSIILSIIIIFIITFLVLIINKIIFNKLSKKEKYDNFRITFIKRLIKSFIIFLSIVVIFYQIPFLKSLSVTLFASTGIFAIIIGFASQEAFSNFISGGFIILFKPFKIGNVIKMTSSDIIGTVEDITLRHTIIKTFENKRIVIPNAVINKEIIENADLIDPKVCKFFDLGISYDSSIEKAISIIKEEILKHPYHIDTRTSKDIEDDIEEITVRVINFGDSSVNLRAWLWGEDIGKAFQMACDLNQIIKKRFDNEGIEIPFPHRTIVYKNPIS